MVSGTAKCPSCPMFHQPVQMPILPHVSSTRPNAHLAPCLINPSKCPSCSMSHQPVQMPILPMYHSVSSYYIWYGYQTSGRQLTPAKSDTHRACTGSHKIKYVCDNNLLITLIFNVNYNDPTSWSKQSSAFISGIIITWQIVEQTTCNPVRYESLHRKVFYKKT
jgi:hypothetical protein